MGAKPKASASSNLEKRAPFQLFKKAHLLHLLHELFEMLCANIILASFRRHLLLLWE
jgi:hypothetical protein